MTQYSDVAPRYKTAMWRQKTALHPRQCMLLIELYNFYLLRIQWTLHCQSKSCNQSQVQSLNLRFFAMIVPTHTALKHTLYIFFDNLVHWIFEHYLGGSGAPRIPSFCITCTSCILTPTLCMTFKNFSVQWTAQLFWKTKRVKSEMGYHLTKLIAMIIYYNLLEFISQPVVKLEKTYNCCSSIWQKVWISCLSQWLSA